MKPKRIFDYAKTYAAIKAGRGPLSLIVFVSGRCNLNCRHCFWKQLPKKSEEMSVKEYEKIAANLPYPLINLNLTGGEPFMRNDITKIVKTFVKLNRTQNIIISTNGTLTDKILKDCSEISSFTPNLHVYVSLDGTLKIHDRIRGVNGTYKKALKTIKSLKEIGVDVSICSTITTENKDEVRHLVEMSKKLNVGFMCDPVRGKPRMSAVKPPEYDAKNVVFGKEFDRYLMKRKFDALSGKGKFNCLAGNYIGVIYSNGDVSICEMQKPFGNIKNFNYDFRGLWKSRPKPPDGCTCSHGCFIGPSIYYSRDFLFHKFQKI
jgi:MoaA/NifB/PqqE/SkfB family radical SAM enzyme